MSARRIDVLIWIQKMKEDVVRFGLKNMVELGPVI